MHGLFFMYQNSIGEVHYKYSNNDEGFVFLPISATRKIAPLYVDWSSISDNNGKVKLQFLSNSVISLDTKEVEVDVTNNLIFDEINTSLSIDATSSGTISIAKIEEAPQPSQLPTNINSTSSFYFNAESNGTTFENGTIGIPIITFNENIDLATLTWLKREDEFQPWAIIGGSINEESLISTVPFDSFSEFTIGSISAVCNIKLNLEGSYSSINQNMNTNLVEIPLTQPFNIAPFYYETYDERVSPEFFDTNENIVDWILVELRDGETPETATEIKGRKACFVLSDGTVIDKEGTIDL